MKILKIVGLSIAGLIVLLLLVAAVLPSTYHIERESVLGAPSGAVFTQVADLRQWEHWSPWKDIDPKTAYTFRGIPGSVGSVWSWKSPIAGSGSMTLARVEPGKSVHIALAFTEPNTMHSTFTWRFEDLQQGGTRAVWMMDGELSWPIERLMGPFFDSWMGTDFEKGLVQLKSRVENPPSP